MKERQRLRNVRYAFTIRDILSDLTSRLMKADSRSVAAFDVVVRRASGMKVYKEILKTLSRQLTISDTGEYNRVIK